MDFTALPPIGLLLQALVAALTTTTDLLRPLTGAAAPIAAIVLFTALVRLLTLPAVVRQVRAERDRLRLAPQLAELRRRHGRDAAALQRATQRLYEQEGVSPFAGCLPTLAQAPVLAAVSAVFVHPVIAGHQNALLSLSFLGTPLGANLAAVAAAPAGPWVVLGTLALLAALVWANAETARRRLGTAAPSGAAGTLSRVLPLVTVVFAALAPFAAAVCLTASAAWTLGERGVLHRRARTA